MASARVEVFSFFFAVSKCSCAVDGGDIVCRDGDGNTAIWLMNGASLLSAAGLGTVPTTWSVVQTGDYDGNGTSDLMWRDTGGNTAIWFMSDTMVASSSFVGNIPTTWTVQSDNAE
jgi:hypothetical protein